MADPESPLIRLSGAGVKRDGRWLVRGVDLALSRGEIVTLIGPNGSGKTTTARMALGILAPDEGARSARAGLRIGYVPQKFAVDPFLPLPVSRFMRLTAPLPDDALGQALERAGVSGLANAQVRDLSGGEFQRVALARAIASRPDLLVLDEPVQGVDVAGESALYSLIASLRRDLDCAVLLVSHDLHFVMAATDHVICLNGHICCEGSPQAVSATDAYRRLFGERGAGVLAVYEHHHDHTHLPDGRVRHADGSVTAHCHPDDGHHHGEAGTRHDHAGGGHKGDA